ncbi:hypothetical protein JAAARDRAFT_340664 [Jaapia argillacea MUCL 33604]|uniref:G domain-containing protein n=1 Tax=Jaapia argillacea MUCL 33604 TaxID=933084 RepID=A0A067PXJ9_9AGAM|nr:hypothetical protein JAAARDRAFT_340664 [Jaapia argillacea MUCL 33604]
MQSLVGSPFLASPTVIVFGETGSGKSSLVNMLADETVAKISSDARGCTFESTAYHIRVSNADMRIYDTAGLGEADQGTVSATLAIANLYKLIRSLDSGINLLVYVIRGNRLKEMTTKNYQMFYDIFCKKKVPIVLVVTGLEGEDDMDQWWGRNEKEFAKYGMKFAGQACVTKTKGKSRDGVHLYQQEYDQSKSTVEEMIARTCSPIPWTMERNAWFVHVVQSIYNKFSKWLPFEPVALSKSLFSALRQIAGMGAEEAKAVANQVEKQIVTAERNGR